MAGRVSLKGLYSRVCPGGTKYESRGGRDHDTKVGVGEGTIDVHI